VTERPAAAPGPQTNPVEKLRLWPWSGVVRLLEMVTWKRLEAGSSKLEAKVMVSVSLSLEPQASCLKLIFGAALAPETC
jgi:hypothetical protein